MKKTKFSLQSSIAPAITSSRINSNSITNSETPTQNSNSKTQNSKLSTQISKLKTQLHWYAVYTNPRAEKKAHAELVSKGIETYLPLQRILKLWSDRKKWVEEPLFRSYIFVNISQKQYFDVLNTPGVVRYITFEGKAVPVPEKQIAAIRYYLADESDSFDFKSNELPVPGTPVEIMRGPLRGLTGELVHLQGRDKVRIQIDALGQFLNLTISSSDLHFV